jgi:hypothetical protein
MARRWLTVAAVCCVMGVLAGAAPSGSRVADGQEGDLRVDRLNPDAAPPNGRTVVHAFVYNDGQETAAGAFTVTVTLPAGTQPEGPYFPKTCHPVEGSKAPQVACSFPAGLPSGQSATALVPVRLGPAVKGTLTGEVRVESENDPDPSNNVLPFDIPVSS